MLRNKICNVKAPTQGIINAYTEEFYTIYCLQLLRTKWSVHTKCTQWSAGVEELYNLCFWWIYWQVVVSPCSYGVQFMVQVVIISCAFTTVTSSAYLTTWQLSSRRSFVMTLNKVGDRTAPYGTEAWTLCSAEEMPFTWAYICLTERKEPIMQTNCGEMLRPTSFSMSV